MTQQYLKVINPYNFSIRNWERLPREVLLTVENTKYKSNTQDFRERLFNKMLIDHWKEKSELVFREWVSKNYDNFKTLTKQKNSYWVRNQKMFQVTVRCISFFNR